MLSHSLNVGQLCTKSQQARYSIACEPSSAVGKKREKNSASVAQASHVAWNIWGSLIVYWPYFAGTSFHDSRSPDEQMSCAWNRFSRFSIQAAIHWKERKQFCCSLSTCKRSLWLTTQHRKTIRYCNGNRGLFVLDKTVLCIARAVVFLLKKTIIF